VRTTSMSGFGQNQSGVRHTLRRGPAPLHWSQNRTPFVPPNSYVRDLGHRRKKQGHDSQVARDNSLNCIRQATLIERDGSA
jgi:hypothetical protein